MRVHNNKTPTANLTILKISPRMKILTKSWLKIWMIDLCNQRGIKNLAEQSQNVLSQAKKISFPYFLILLQDPCRAIHIFPTHTIKISGSTDQTSSPGSAICHPKEYQRSSGCVWRCHRRSYSRRGCRWWRGFYDSDNSSSEHREIGKNLRD